jgi:hypothetical protein
MPIVSACACGFRFKAPDRLAGKKARCPKCGGVVSIPAQEPEDGAAEAPAPDLKATEAPAVAEKPAEPAAASMEEVKPKAVPDTETDEGPAALPPKDDIGEAPPPPPAEETKDGGPARAAEETGPGEEEAKTPPETEAKEEPKAEPASSTRGRTARLRRDLSAKSAPKAEKAAARAEKPVDRGPARPSAIGEYLGFERMITPSIVKLLFWLGEGLLVLAGLGSVVTAILAMVNGEILSGLVFLVAGPVATILWMLMWRVACEMVLLNFRVYDRLGEIRDGLARVREGAPPAPPAPASPAGPPAPADAAVPAAPATDAPPVATDAPSVAADAPPG